MQTQVQAVASPSGIFLPRGAGKGFGRSVSGVLTGWLHGRVSLLWEQGLAKVCGLQMQQPPAQQCTYSQPHPTLLQVGGSIAGEA